VEWQGFGIRRRFAAEASAAAGHSDAIPGSGGGAFRIPFHWCRSGDGGAGCDGGSSPCR
jgi:hypothetical protein